MMAAPYNLVCPECEAQIVLWDWGWLCSICEATSQEQEVAA